MGNEASPAFGYPYTSTYTCPPTHLHSPINHRLRVAERHAHYALKGSYEPTFGTDDDTMMKMMAGKEDHASPRHVDLCTTFTVPSTTDWGLPKGTPAMAGSVESVLSTAQLDWCMSHRAVLATSSCGGFLSPAAGKEEGDR
jgi:hypothetical protein